MVETLADGPSPKQGILDIAPYVPGRAKAPGGTKIYKLSSNESPLGASAKAEAAAAGVLKSLFDYPDGSATDLREAIAEVHGLNSDHILCGNGSDEILAMVAQTFLGAGDEAIYTEHGFLVYPIAIKAQGATPVVVKEEDFAANVDAILAAVTDRTKVIFLANPNNPTGTYVPFDEIKRLHSALPRHILLVLDAAYAEYVRRNDYQAGTELAGEAPNVLMTRTFSKIYGLAGLRIGWGYGAPELINLMNRVRGPFNLNSAAIAAGVAAIKDRRFIEDCVVHNEQWLPWCKRELEALGLKVTPSVGNFLLVHFPDRDGKRAPDADSFLLDRGIILRQVGAYGLPNALRMTIGDEDANHAVIDALKTFLSA